MSTNTIWRISCSVRSLISNLHKCSKSVCWNLVDATVSLKRTNYTFPNRLNYSSSKYFRNQDWQEFEKYQLSTVRVINRNEKYGKSNESKLVVMALTGIFSIFQSKEEEEESELIMTIKRAVLMIQHDEFKSAEQMLHVALRLAQQTQNSDGVTYVYDLLANVAFAQGELEKAETLFKNVMQRELAKGTTQEDLKIIHMSLKLAKIYEQKHEMDKAEEGYKFCKEQLDMKVKGSEDEDVLMLWGMTMDWYARFLHEQNRLDEAFINYKKAYEMCVRLNGDVDEQTVVLLNDLGTISFLRGDNDNAILYMTKAVETGRHLPNMEDFSSVYVNLGNIYMQKEMYDEAQKHCKEGLKNAKRHKNEEGLREATVCLEDLKKFLRN